MDLLCDVSLKLPRVLVPENWRHQVFGRVDSLAHPSGKTTLAILSRSYVWPGVQKDVITW